MEKRFRTLTVALWSALLLFTLCTVSYMREIRADLLKIQNNISRTECALDSLNQTISEMSDEIEMLRTELADSQKLIAEMQACSEPVEPELEEPEPIVEPELYLSEDEINLIALVTMAEAEGEPEEGKRLVIDTILNRVDSDYSYWPDTVTDVIYQPSQFSAMWNGRVDRCYVDDYYVQLVKEELLSRTNSDVVYFRMYHYSPYGTPMFQVGNHYFSSL